MRQVIDAHQLSAGIGFQGDLARPRAFMHKLMRGDPIKLGAQGTSAQSSPQHTVFTSTWIGPMFLRPVFAS